MNEEEQIGRGKKKMKKRSEKRRSTIKSDPADEFQDHQMPKMILGF